MSKRVPHNVCMHLTCHVHTQSKAEGPEDSHRGAQHATGGKTEDLKCGDLVSMKGPERGLHGCAPRRQGASARQQNLGAARILDRGLHRLRGLLQRVRLACMPGAPT